MKLSADSRTSLRSLAWKHPPKRRYPLAIETAVARVSAATSAPHSARYLELFGDAPVPGKERERAKRSDGAMNVGTLLQTMIASADIPSGYVATPIGDRRWKRKTYYDLDGLAFGEQVPDERSFRRTERAAAQLVAMKLIRSVPWRVHTAAGIRSTAGAKFITDKCWRMLGVLHLVREERRRRERQKGQERVAQLIGQNSNRNRGKLGAVFTGAPVANSGFVDEPIPFGSEERPPDRGKASEETSVADEQIEAIRALLNR